MKKRSDDGPGEIDLTPMLDVVFILLIFFIVTATFLKENAIEMTPPPQGAAEITNPAIIVRIDENGLVRVNGQLSDIGGVRANIERALAAEPGQSVIVQAPKGARVTDPRVRAAIADVVAEVSAAVTAVDNVVFIFVIGVVVIVPVVQ